MTDSVTIFNFQKPKHFLIFHLENFRSSFQPGGGGGIIKSFIFRNSSKWPRSGTKKGPRGLLDLCLGLGLGRLFLEAFVFRAHSLELIQPHGREESL